MANKVFTVAIIGAGSRGADIYGRLLMELPEKFKIVALCDPRQNRLDTFGAEFGISESERYTDENTFFEKLLKEINWIFCIKLCCK